MQVNSIIWVGRLGNNIQQICNAILFSEKHNQGFRSPHHPLIKEINYNNENQPPNNFEPFFTLEDSEKIHQTAKQYITPNLNLEIGEPFDNDTLVIHIRSGDIFYPQFCPNNYVPNPLSYYLQLIQQFKKTIVVTEPDDYNPVVQELKKNKIEIYASSVKQDFEMLLRAKNLASSGIGTFAIAAAMCSPHIENFYCTNLYHMVHLNPTMLKNIKIHKTQLKNYFTSFEWTNSDEDRKFILEYNL